LTRRFNILVDQLRPVLARLLPAAADHASSDGKMPHRPQRQCLRLAATKPQVSLRERCDFRFYRTEKPAKFAYLLCPDVLAFGAAGVLCCHRVLKPGRR
jgi:hypothetical protein